MKKIITVLLHLIIFLIYFLVFPAEGELETVFKPQWDVKAENTSAYASSAKENIPFETREKLGFVNSNGNIVYIEDKQYGVVFAKDVFISYSWVSNNLVARDINGSIVSSVDIHGYPIIINNRFFAVSSDRSIIAEFNINGDLLWSRQFISRLSAIDANSENLVLGFLDSSMLLLDNKGQDIFKHVFSGSRINIVYSLSLSENSEDLFAVTGLGPQKLTIFKNEKELYKLKKEIFLGSDLRREIFTGQLDLSGLFYVEQDKKILFYRKSGKLFGEESITYNLKDLGPLDNKYNLLFLVSSDSSRSEFKIFTPGKGPFVSYDFNAENIRISLFQNGFLFVKDEHLIKLEVLEL